MVVNLDPWCLKLSLGRIPEIADEWELPTFGLMQQHNSTMVDMLQDPQWSPASVLPDGSYSPQPLCVGDLNNDESVSVTDVLILLDGWGGQMVQQISTGMAISTSVTSCYASMRGDHVDES